MNLSTILKILDFTGAKYTQIIGSVLIAKYTKTLCLSNIYLEVFKNEREIIVYYKDVDKIKLIDNILFISYYDKVLDQFIDEEIEL
jgi:hypothetical protein